MKFSFASAKFLFRYLLSSAKKICCVQASQPGLGSARFKDKPSANQYQITDCIQLKLINGMISHVSLSFRTKKVFGIIFIIVDTVSLHVSNIHGLFFELMNYEQDQRSQKLTPRNNQLKNYKRLRERLTDMQEIQIICK